MKYSPDSCWASTFNFSFLGRKNSFAFQKKKNTQYWKASIYPNGRHVYDRSWQWSLLKSLVLFNIPFILWRSVLWLFKLCVFLVSLSFSPVNTSTNHLLEQNKLLVMYAAKASFKSFVKAPVQALWQNCHKTLLSCLSWSSILSSCFPHQTEEVFATFTHKIWVI